jgi:NADPH:quinone reductase-like Zn-dependent oxidoreductase
MSAAAAVAPQGRFALIDDPPTLDVIHSSASASPALGIHVHALDVRNRRYGRARRAAQRSRQAHRRRHARTTLTEKIARFDAANLRRAHAVIESGRARGKIVLEGF